MVYEIIRILNIINKASNYKNWIDLTEQQNNIKDLNEEIIKMRHLILHTEGLDLNDATLLSNQLIKIHFCLSNVVWHIGEMQNLIEQFAPVLDSQDVSS